MFAHKVLEDLSWIEENLDTIDNKDEYFRLIKAHHQYIPSSHLFHFHESYEIAKINSIHNKLVIPTDYLIENFKYFNIPYKLTSFMWNTGKNRVFSLLVKNNYFIRCSFIEYSPKMSRFILHPTLICFDL